MATKQLSKIARSTALLSFVGGTGLTLLFFKTPSNGLLFMGYIYVIIVLLVNFGLFTAVLIRLFKDKAERKPLLVTSGLMLLNVPFLILYFNFVIILLNTMRVTFVNTTTSEVSNLKIIGCEPQQLDRLDVGESKTVWIAITGDCSLNIEYYLDGKINRESVAGYCTNDMGQKITYRIGTDKEPVF